MTPALGRAPHDFSLETTDADVLLIGAGIMSATVAALLLEVAPSLRVVMVDRLDRVAGESTDARNNAGTGHAALCELNYTPEREDGSIDVAKAIAVNRAFDLSLEFWAHLARRGVAGAPGEFVRSVPHVSFVTGGDDVDFLRRRFEAMRVERRFADLRFTTDASEIARWAPLVIEGRDPAQPVAATRSDRGTDVDFGALTRAMVGHLTRRRGLDLALGHHVEALGQEGDGRWLLELDDAEGGRRREIRARFVFVGAGGGALPLLEASGIAEARGYGGFPVSGEWLVCDAPGVVARHAAKVYGKAKVGAPPMSVPHLDTRVIDGQRTLMFGPFAGFSTRFLKAGSYLDLPRSLTPDNLLPLLGAGLRNLGLTRYLLDEVTRGFDDKIAALRAFMPTARADDWRLEVAGQRVQIIKRDDDDVGRLEFGTEIVSSADGTLAALLGASPGASTSVKIALDLLEVCFADRLATPAWRERLREVVPSYHPPGEQPHHRPVDHAAVDASTRDALGLR